jgi:chromosome segregation ATPase
MARRSPALPLLAALPALLLPAAARADAASEGRLRDALRAATAQLRALEDERATWQARETASRKELDLLRAQARSAQAPRGDRRELSELKERLAERTEAASAAAEALVRCEAARDEAARAGQDERGRLSAENTSLAERLAAAEAKNERLYRVGKDIIDWLSRVGVGAALAAREPVLGLKRVELENAAQDHEDALIEQRIRRAGGSP